MKNAKNNQEAISALVDALRDVQCAQSYAKGKDYYDKTPLVLAKLEEAWNAIYDARQIVLGNHK